MKRIFSGFLHAISSYWLACTILLLLALLTYLGTLAQVELGLFQAQKRYFESWVVLHPLTDYIILPLPGVVLLLVLLSLNLLVGGILRLRRKPQNVGLFVVHGGILFLLLGGLVTWVVGYDGQMTLAPGQQSSRFQSYHDWELAVTDPSPEGHNVEYTLDAANLKGLERGDGRVRLMNEELPFTVEVTRYFENAAVQPKGPMVQAPTPVIGDFYVQPLRRDQQSERNMPAAYITLVDKATGEEQQEILWGNSLRPLVVEAGDGEQYGVSLRHTTWDIPFAIELVKFTREFHPGTEQPRHFQSDVIKVDGDSRQPTIIRMNEPLRTEGYVFFQASYLEDPRTGQLSSTLAVARNPADQWPLWACVIITSGMMLHFGLRLARYLRRERALTT